MTVHKEDIMHIFEQEQMKRLMANKSIPEFRSGDKLSITLRIIDGASERTQIFEGVCIARTNRGLNSSFLLRKISFGEGVEKLFPLYSPMIKEIKVLNFGRVRRAKLYYLRDLSDKAARIKPDTKRQLQAVAEAKANKQASKKS